MRFKLHTILAGLCAGLLFCTIAQAQVQPLDRVAAIVENDVVMMSQVESRMNEVRQQLRARGESLPEESLLRDQVLDRLFAGPVLVVDAGIDHQAHCAEQFSLQPANVVVGILQ